MFQRNKFKYIATIQNGTTGQPKEVEIESYWSPEYDGVFDEIAAVAAAKAWWASHKDAQQRTPFAGITARLAD